MAGLTKVCFLLVICVLLIDVVTSRGERRGRRPGGRRHRTTSTEPPVVPTPAAHDEIEINEHTNPMEPEEIFEHEAPSEISESFPESHDSLSDDSAIIPEIQQDPGTLETGYLVEELRSSCLEEPGCKWECSEPGLDESGCICVCNFENNRL